RPAAEGPDGQTVRYRPGHDGEHGALPQYAVDQSVEVAGAGRNHVAGPSRAGEVEQAGPNRTAEREAVRGHGRPNERPRGGRREAAGAAGHGADDCEPEDGGRRAWRRAAARGPGCGRGYAWL